jgi:hypothetical protein
MAVTAPGDDPLPWWMQQGGQPQGRASPPGYGGMSWLNYLASMFQPGAAQAAENNPIATLNAGGTPPVSPAAVNAAISPSASPVGPPPAPAPSAAQGPPGYLSSTGATGGVPVAAMGYYSGAQPGLSAPAMIPGAKGGPATTPGAGPLTPAPGRDITVQPRAPGALAQGDRFGTFSYQVPNSSRNAPIYTAMNLFGGQPAGPLISPTTGQPMPMSSADAAANFHRNNAGNLVPGAPRAAPDFSALPDDVFDQTGRVAGPMARKKRPLDAVAAASLKQRYG